MASSIISIERKVVQQVVKLFSLSFCSLSYNNISKEEASALTKALQEWVRAFRVVYWEFWVSDEHSRTQ